MYAYFTENNLIQPRQSGFRSLHSTVTALLDMKNQWCLNIDKGMVSGVIFLDLKKAFDTVDRAICLTMGYRVKPLLGSSLTPAILRGKRIVVCKKSYVPQGSLLGPLFFRIYVNMTYQIA